MPTPPPQPPSVAGPEAGPAKPAEPGPPEPPSIASSILPQRKRDAARHPKEVEAPEAVAQPDDVIAAEQAAVESGRDSDDS